MNLLIMTQKVDASDPILGFFDRWIDAFAAHCPSVTVLCLEEGTHDLPSSVRVFSLGKEKKQSGNVEGAKKFGVYLAEKLKKKKIARIVFDRGGRPYHGRVRGLAETLRENGIQF